MDKRTPKRDLEAEITDRVIEALERGTVPWEKPWTAAGILPTSVATGRAYRGINVLLLSMTAQARGYDSPYWLTFNQARELGGTVRKGEKGTTVVFWKRLKVEDEDLATGETVEKVVPMMRAYTVFNVEQTDGATLPPRFVHDDDETVEAVEPDVALESILAGYVDGPTVKHVTGDLAAYNPGTDVVVLPKLGQFADAAGYANTVLHELTHSTGHASRLDRFVRNGEPQHFGSERYAKEELVAEMGAALLAVEHGVETRLERHAAYVKNWLGALRDDKSLVVKAAQQAQKAVDRIVGRTFSDATVAETADQTAETGVAA
jgi:antirestriction protein ArdC